MENKMASIVDFKNINFIPFTTLLNPINQLNNEISTNLLNIDSDKIYTINETGTFSPNMEELVGHENAIFSNTDELQNHFKKSNGTEHTNLNIFFTPSIDSVENFNDDNSIIAPPSPSNFLNQRSNSQPVQKNVHYFNHKFVISETEDISVDKLLSLGSTNSNIETTNGTVMITQPAIITTSSTALPQAFLTDTVRSKENRQINKMKIISSTRQGESILKNSENKRNIPIVSEAIKIVLPQNDILQALSSPPSPTDLQTTQQQQPPITIQQPKHFIVNDKIMKSLPSQSQVSSGIFRTPNSLAAKKRKLSDSNQDQPNFINSNVQITSSQQSQPNNIIIMNSSQGKIIPVSQIAQTNVQQQQVQVQNFKTTSAQTTTTSTLAVQLKNGGLTPTMKPINRKLIKIPISALSIMEQNDRAAANSSNQSNDSTGKIDQQGSTANNLVLNIVNMVANNPEITKTTEINHGQFALEKNGFVKTENNLGSLPNSKVSVLNDKKSVVYHNRETNTKIIYRIINPEDVNLKKEESSNSEKTKLKKTIIHRNRPGRPKGVPRKRIVSDTGQNHNMLTQPTARTRAGRLSRPPRHIQNYYKGSTTKFTDTQEENKSKELENLSHSNTTTIAGTTTNLINQNSAEHLNNGQCEPAQSTASDHPVQVIKKERKIPPQYKCKKCNKIYLGYRRMARHLDSHPDHGDAQLFQMKINSMHKYDDNVYQYLLKKIQLTQKENRAKLFFDEIANLVKKIQFLIPKILTESCDYNNLTANSLTTSPSNLLTDETKRLFGIPNGKYTVDMSVLDDDLNLNYELPHHNNTIINHNNLSSNHVNLNLNHEPELTLPLTEDDILQLQPDLMSHHHIENINHHHHNEHDILDNSNHRIDYNLNISLDSNDADKTNLSDDSLLQSVDEFVKERWKNITEDELRSVTNGTVIPIVSNFSGVTSLETPIKDNHHHHHHLHLQHHQPPPILDLSLDYLLN